MAEFSIQLLSNSTTVPASVLRACEKGRLKSLALSVPIQLMTKGTLWIEVGVKSGDVIGEDKTAVFYSGTPSRRNQFLFNGDFPLEPYDTLYFIAVSILQYTLRLKGRIELEDP